MILYFLSIPVSARNSVISLGYFICERVGLYSLPHPLLSLLVCLAVVFPVHGVGMLSRQNLLLGWYILKVKKEELVLFSSESVF